MKILFVNESKIRRKFGDIKLNKGDAVVEINGVKKWMKKGTFEIKDLKDEVIKNETKKPNNEKVESDTTVSKPLEKEALVQAEQKTDIVEEKVEEKVEETPKKTTRKKTTRKTKKPVEKVEE